MNVHEILKTWLKDNGYDGLFNSVGQCGCKIDDLAPCCESCTECEPGYEVPCDGTCDDPRVCKWHIQKEKP